MTIDLGTYSAFLFDFDGSLWTGDAFYDGALEFLDQLSEHGRDIVIVSNTSTATGAELEALLAEGGVDAGLSALTVVDIVGTALVEEVGRCAVRVCGTDALRRACEAAGHTVVPLHDRRRADALLVGLDPTFSYRDLEVAARRIADGERFFVTNDDGFHPGPAGAPVPETGAIASAIRRVVNVKPRVIGKPDARIFSAALTLVGARAAAAIMIGDNLATDIDGAAALGITTAWISHGTALPHPIAHRPDFVSPTIRGLLDIVDAAPIGPIESPIAARAPSSRAAGS